MSFLIAYNAKYKKRKIMDLKKVPYTNGVDGEIKGYVDLTDIVNEAVKEAEKEMKNNKTKNE